MKRKVLILCFTDTNHDIRVARQIDFLKDTYDLWFAGYGVHCSDAVRFIPLSPTHLTFPKKSSLATLLLARQYETAYWMQYPYQSLKSIADSEAFDVIIANDIESLPLAFFLKQEKTKIVFDAHEYAPRHFEDRLYWRVFFQRFNVHFCKKLIPDVDLMFTVCSGLAREYQRNFGISPQVLTNAASFQTLEPGPVDPRRIRLIHHGVVTLSRKIENMIEMMQYTDPRFTLDLMLKLTPTASQKTKKYLRHLQTLANTTTNVRLVPPVSSKEVVSHIHQYDMGIFILEPVNFNYTHALPNKLFDFVQARLGIGISPSIEMKRVVEEFQLGVVSVDFSPRALADQLNRLTDKDITSFKQQSHQVAHRLSANYNRELLCAALRELLSDN